MSVSDTNKNRGTHGDSSFMLGGLPSSSENPPGFSRGERQNLPEVLEAWDYQDTRKVFADEYWDDKAVRARSGLTMEEMLEVLEEMRCG